MHLEDEALDQVQEESKSGEENVQLEDEALDQVQEGSGRSNAGHNIPMINTLSNHSLPRQDLTGYREFFEVGRRLVS